MHTIWEIRTKSQIKFNENRVVDECFPGLSVVRSCSIRKDFSIGLNEVN